VLGRSWGRNLPIRVGTRTPTTGGKKDCEEHRGKAGLRGVLCSTEEEVERFFLEGQTEVERNAWGQEVVQK